MKTHFVIRFLGIATLLGAFSACDTNQSAFSFVGDYSGTTSSGIEFVASITEVGSSTQNKLNLTSHQLSQPAVIPIQGTITLKDPSTLDVELTAGILFSGELVVEDQNDACYSGANFSSTLTLCSTKSGFTLSRAEGSNVNSSLTFNRVTNDEINKLEPAQAYSSSQLRDLSSNGSFQDRTEIEQVIQAKLSSRVAYLNLLPHLNANSALAASQYSGLLSVIGSVGDLVPFLLPDRWFQANESKEIYQSEILASLIMKLDTMQSVEGLAINLGRDNAIDLQLQKDLQAMQLIQVQVQAMEASGKLPLGSADSVSSTINILAQTDSDLQSNIALEYTALAQAVGFVNPGAISAVTVDNFGDIEHPTVYDLPTLETSVLAVSPELQQLSSLFAAAQSQKDARAFQWLDPAGDDQGSLGFGLPSYLQIGQSNVREVAIQRDQTNSSVLKAVTDNYNNYTGWIESYQLAQAGIAIQERRLADYQTLLSTGGAGLEISELQDALAQLSVNRINLLTAQYAWFDNVSLFNRLLALGAYKH